MEHIYIQAFAALHKTGMYSSVKGHIPWEKEQSGSPLDVQRKQVYGKPYTGFGKLNAPEKLAFSAAALLFSDFSDYNGEMTGISLGNVFGSFSTDMRYAESIAAGFPSPAYFSATLPSSPIAEVAIPFKLKGPDRVVVGTATPGLSALDNAMRILSLKKAESMLVLLVNGIEHCDTDFPLISSEKANTTYSYAWFLTTARCDSGINYKITFDNYDKTYNNSQNVSEESYFFEMINAMTQNKNYSSSFTIDGMNGSVILKKD